VQLSFTYPAISISKAGRIAMFDISDPEQPRLLKALDLDQGSGPHYIALIEDGR
jgi:hypothetical protein